MNLSSSLMSNMGISLGGIEIATDYLTNPELYESEIAEIKESVSNKPQQPVQKVIKPVQPTVKKENIINKFSLVQPTTKVVTDETLDSGTIVHEVDNFDFDFKEEPKSKDEIIKEIESSDAEELAASLDLMSRLQEGNKSQSLNEEMDTDEDNIEIEEDDIEIDEDDIDSIDDIEIDEADIDSLGDIDDIDIDEDDIASIDNIDEDESETIDIDDNELDIDDIEIEGDDIEIEGDDIEVEGDEELNFDEIDIENDIESDNIDILDFEEDEEKKSNIKVNNTNNSSDIKEQKSTEQKDIENLKAQLADIQKQIHQSNKNNTQTTALKQNESVSKNKEIDKLDTLIESSKHQTNRQVIGSEYDKYTVMKDEELYKYVQAFLIKHGVRQKPVDIDIVNKEFGALNIQKLIKKCHLIKIGKGVTVGI